MSDEPRDSIAEFDSAVARTKAELLWRGAEPLFKAYGLEKALNEGIAGDFAQAVTEEVNRKLSLAALDHREETPLLNIVSLVDGSLFADGTWSSVAPLVEEAIVDVARA